MGLFEGKTGIVMGVANGHSIASHISKFLHDEGAELGFSHLPDKEGRNRMEKRVRQVVDSFNPKLVAPCDVNSDEDLNRFFSEVASTYGGIDFLVHSIAFAPVDDIRCPTVEASREGFSLAMETSVYSFIAASKHASRLMNDGGSIVTMTYLGGERVLPGYNMMGLCKSALEMSVRYLAYDLGRKNIRVNGVSAGPVKTLAASAVGDFSDMMSLYEHMSPLGRNIRADEVATTTGYLLSPLSSGVTGDILHVDAGYHAMGGPASADLKEMAGK